MCHTVITEQHRIVFRKFIGLVNAVQIFILFLNLLHQCLCFFDKFRLFCHFGLTKLLVQTVEHFAAVTGHINDRAKQAKGNRCR